MRRRSGRGARAASRPSRYPGSSASWSVAEDSFEKVRKAVPRDGVTDSTADRGCPPPDQEARNDGDVSDVHPMRDWIPDVRDLLINGKLVAEGEQWDVYNPATEEVLATVRGASLEQVDVQVAAAREVLPAWSALSGEERSRHIHRLADVFEAAADRLLPSIVNEVGTPSRWRRSRYGWRSTITCAGRPTRQGRSHGAPGCVPRSSADRERHVLAPGRSGGRDHRLQLPAESRRLQVRGGVGCGVHGRAAAVPAHAADHAVHGRADPRGRAARPGVFNGDRQRRRRAAAVVAPGRRPGVVHRLRRRGGSDHGPGGGEPHRRTPELGGKSPSIVLLDVDVMPIAVEMHLRWSRNGGQGCAALARLLVHESIYDEFLEASTPRVRPDDRRRSRDPATNIALMIRPEHRARGARLHRRLAVGGRKVLEVTKPLPERGWFVNPVLLGDLPPDAPSRRRSSVRSSYCCGSGTPTTPSGWRHAVRPGREYLVERPGGGAPDRRADPRRHGLDQRRRR